MKSNMIKKMGLFLSITAMAASLAACGTSKNSGTSASSASSAASAENSSAENTKSVVEESSGSSASSTSASATSEAISPSSESQVEEADVITGGWETNDGELSLDKNEDAKAAFEKATEGLEGYTYEPIAYLGSQVVAGINYAILCKGEAVIPDAEPAYEIVYVYEDLEGNAEVTGNKMLVGGQDDKAMDGAYEANDGDAAIDRNADVKAVFDKAFDGLAGASYEPVAYLGSQVVEGTNYLGLFRETPAVQNPVPEFDLVTAYEDLDGNVTLEDIETVDLGDMDETES